MINITGIISQGPFSNDDMVITQIKNIIGGWARRVVKSLII
jgi:hypothetical protein